MYSDFTTIKMPASPAKGNMGFCPVCKQYKPLKWDHINVFSTPATRKFCSNDCLAQWCYGEQKRNRN